MITKIEKLAMTMAGISFADCRDAWILRARLEAGRVADARQWLLDNGLEVVDARPNDLLTADGREIFRSHGKAWALLPEIHAKRRADALAAAQDKARGATARQVPTPSPGEALSSVLCPSCHHEMAKTPICPNCKLGKQGYRIMCTCTDCGQEVPL
jgi:hypothetical protein